MEYESIYSRDAAKHFSHRSFARSCDVEYESSFTPDLIELHWLPIKHRIDFKVLLLVFKSIHKQTPDYISSMLQIKISQRRLRSTSTSSPQFMEHRTQHSTFADRSFACYAPRLWNRLPDFIKGVTSVETFKKLLKQHLFQIAYSQWLLLCIYFVFFVYLPCLCFSALVQFSFGFGAI